MGNPQIVIDTSRTPLAHLQTRKLPSDTKLLLTKNYFEIIIFEKLRISRVISGKSLSFLEILRVQIPSKITKNNSQGIIFAIISCQRVRHVWKTLEPHFRRTKLAGNILETCSCAQQKLGGGVGGGCNSTSFLRFSGPFFMQPNEPFYINP